MFTSVMSRALALVSRSSLPMRDRFMQECAKIDSALETISGACARFGVTLEEPRLEQFAERLRRPELFGQIQGASRSNHSGMGPPTILFRKRIAGSFSDPARIFPTIDLQCLSWRDEVGMPLLGICVANEPFAVGAGPSPGWGYGYNLFRQMRRRASGVEIIPWMKPSCAPGWIAEQYTDVAAKLMEGMPLPHSTLASQRDTKAILGSVSESPSMARLRRNAELIFAPDTMHRDFTPVNIFYLFEPEEPFVADEVSIGFFSSLSHNDHRLRRKSIAWLMVGEKENRLYLIGHSGE